ncbi:restriction endonuclease [Aeromonas dhakensis]|uniref:restriction endonuclease n=1 Tax=Aeromonas dhakensis TaxID=196024 RepID=UPI00191D50E5|nr:restriction endonuclease [Aeromonas dhakensis]MBL0676490.1 restriction endonuclease [Aeromonas dhakensis]MDX7740365.1 restriction endonuclease [Aeromonas dhakensis]WAG01143.1 restriction endonuclease [Aeromonas dhakensis]
MIEKEVIIERLNTLHEHKMAKDIFVPVLRKMQLQGVKFTGGSDEHGIDIEYYELTQPEQDKSYVGIQFKKGDIVYSSGGSKNSVKELKNQAEEAFEKEMHDIDGHATRYISRFIVATTGEINEPARKYIGRARQKGLDRRIDYWPGDRLAEYVQQYWEQEFVEYFNIKQDEEEIMPESIIDVEYIEENYPKLVKRAQQLRATVDSVEWGFIRELLDQTINTGGGAVPLADLLMELGHTEDYYMDEISHLFSLGYLYADESGFSLDGHARILWELHETIDNEVTDAEDEPENTADIFSELID